MEDAWSSALALFRAEQPSVTLLTAPYLLEVSGERFAFAAMASLGLFGSYWLCQLFYFCIGRWAYAQRWKIENGRPPPTAAMLRQCVVDALVGQVCGLLLVVVVLLLLLLLALLLVLHLQLQLLQLHLALLVSPTADPVGSWGSCCCGRRCSSSPGRRCAPWAAASASRGCRACRRCCGSCSCASRCAIVVVVLLLLLVLLLVLVLVLLVLL